MLFDATRRCQLMMMLYFEIMPLFFIQHTPLLSRHAVTAPLRHFAAAASHAAAAARRLRRYFEDAIICYALFRHAAAFFHATLFIFITLPPLLADAISLLLQRERCYFAYARAAAFASFTLLLPLYTLIRRCYDTPDDAAAAAYAPLSFRADTPFHELSALYFRFLSLR